jgi:hypothetical protein
MITVTSIQTAVTAAMFLAAGFLVINVVLASGRVIRGKDSVTELPTRLIGVGFALAIAFAAWPYARTQILNTVGRDAGAMVQTLNSLGEVGSITTGADVGLDVSEFSGQSWGNVTTAIMDAINAPEPEQWTDAPATGSQPFATPVVFKPVEVNGTPATGEMSVNDPNLAPTFPDPTPTPFVVQASYQGDSVTTELRTTVDNTPWLEFATDDTGKPLTGAMSQPEANMSVQRDSSPFKVIGGGGGPTNPPVKPASAIIVERGDTMHKIAHRWYGDGSKWPAICKANQPMDCDSLVAGQTLTMP